MRHLLALPLERLHPVRRGDRRPRDSAEGQVHPHARRRARAHPQPPPVARRRRPRDRLRYAAHVLLARPRSRHGHPGDAHGQPRQLRASTPWAASTATSTRHRSRSPQGGRHTRGADQVLHRGRDRRDYADPAAVRGPAISPRTMSSSTASSARPAAPRAWPATPARTTPTWRTRSWTSRWSPTTTATSTAGPSCGSAS